MKILLFCSVGQGEIAKSFKNSEIYVYGKLYKGITLYGHQSDKCRTEGRMGMGASIIEVKDLSIDEENFFEGIDAKAKDFLKTHTISDLRKLVFEMYDDGEDVSQMVGLVSDLEYFAHELSVREPGQISEYDLAKVEKEIEEVFY